MPPRVVQGTDVGTGFRAWYEGLPPVTRLFATACFLCTAGQYVGLVNPGTVALVWPLIWNKFQLWRLFSSAIFIGKFSVKFAIELLWLLTYGAKLESTTYALAPADFVFMLLFGTVALALVSLLVPFVQLYFVGSPLILMILYVWSRNFPDQLVSIWGLVTIKSFYLPFATLALSVIQGADPLPDVMGILVGHLWWFLTDLYPSTSGVRLVQTPRWLKRALADAGIGAPQAPRPDGPAVAAPGFSAFRGQGRRLGGT